MSDPIREAGLMLDSYSLASKWGFSDGDEPDDYLDWCDANNYEYPDDWHNTLGRLVRDYLLPAIPADVQVCAIDTLHNPIRAARVNGVEVDGYGNPATSGIPFVTVTIPYETVREVANQ